MCRPFVFMTEAELRDKYRAMKGIAPKSVWKKTDLITEILRPESGSETRARRRTNSVRDDSLVQELVNIVVRGMALKALQGGAKDNCMKGHEMEEIYSQLLVENDNFPADWGVIEEVARSGLVQKMAFHT